MALKGKSRHSVFSIIAIVFTLENDLIDPRQLAHLCQLFWLEAVA